MKRSITSLVIALTAFAAVPSLVAATPEQEKAFVDSYKKALESGDKAALNAFLYTEGATAETVDFFKMMQEAGAGQKVSSIELVAPTKEEMAKFGEPMEMPDGKKYKMPIQPIKQLVVVIEEKSENGSSKSTSKSPVAEKAGKLVIPVPVPADGAKPAAKDGGAKAGKTGKAKAGK